MRAALAALAVVVLPALAGARWFAGPALARLGLGSMVGFAAMGYGTVLAGLAGVPEAPLAGGAAGLLLAALAGPRLRTRVAGAPGGAATRGLLLAVVAVGALALALAVLRPVAGYDAWAIWSLKAKDIASTGGFGGAVFRSEAYLHAHPDYPVLLPAAQAVIYRLSGDLAVGWPLQVQLVALWFGGALGLLATVRRWGAAATAVVLAWVVAPHVVRQALSGYADVPMALLLLGGAALLVDPVQEEGAGEDAAGAGAGEDAADAGVGADRGTGTRPGARLGTAPAAALLLAAAGATKHEGLAMALAVAVAVALLVRGRRRAALAAGATTLLAAVPWWVFTSVQGLTNDVATGIAGGASPEPGTVLARLPLAVGAVLREAVWPPRWGVLAVVAVALLVTAHRRLAGSWARRLPACASALLLAGGAGAALVVAVYALTPHDFWWHVGGSVDRVVTAPLGLLALAAAVAVARTSPAAAVRPPRAAPSSRSTPGGSGRT